MKNVYEHPSVSLNVQTLLDERHTLKDRTAYQPMGSGQWMGPFRGARRGQGTEFDDLRHYSVGDDPRHIDWKASARTNVVHTRLYREERQYRTTLVIDMRDELFTGTSELQAVRICRLAARLLWQLIDGGSKTQVLIVTDSGLGFSEAGSGHKAAIDACSLMAQLFESRQSTLRKTPVATSSSTSNTEQPAATTSSVTTNAKDVLLHLAKQAQTSDHQTIHLEQVAEWMLQQAEQQATVFWISAFDHCGIQFDQRIELLSQHSKQIAIIVEDDVMQTGLPAGHYSYQTSTNTKESLNAKSQTLSKQITLNRKSSSTLKDTLSKLKLKRESRLSKLLMPIFHFEEYGENLIPALRHHGYLP